MELNTAAAVISYIRKIEEESANYYRKWAGKNDRVKDAFLAFADENAKNASRIKRTYYSVISDALETGFSFKGLTADVHIPLLEENCPMQDVLQASIAMEENIQDFYRRAAQSSKAFLADVPRAMELVAGKRDERIQKLTLIQA